MLLTNPLDLLFNLFDILPKRSDIPANSLHLCNNSEYVRLDDNDCFTDKIFSELPSNLSEILNRCLSIAHKTLQQPIP